MSAGLLLLDKPSGMSSARAIAHVKRRLEDVRRIGHAGTLDPMATGLLICCINGATRLAAYAEAGAKVYSGTIVFGLTTDSDDITGKELSRSENLPTLDRVQECSQQFTGKISQVPPQVSALKVGGKRAYALARKGITAALAPRIVEVFSFDILGSVPGFDLQTPVSEISFQIKCSKGTYIRSLARDLGQLLGCGGCLGSLRREASLPFHVEEARQLDDVSGRDILSWDRLFPEAVTLPLSAHQVQLFRVGDQRIIRQVGSALHARSGDASSPVDRAVCVNESSGQAVSLFVREGLDWKLAVNVAS